MAEWIRAWTTWLEGGERLGGIWILGLALAGAAFAALVFLLVRICFFQLHRRVAALQGTRIRAVRYQGQEIFSEREVALVLLGLLRLVRYAVYVLVAFAYLTFTFGLFPATGNLAARLLGSFLTAVERVVGGALDFLPNLVFLLVLFFFVRGAIRLMSLAFDRLADGRLRLASFPQEFAQPTYKILRFLLVVFAIMVAYPYLPGSGSAAFRGVSIFLGVLVSLGSSGAVANFVSGIALTYMRAFKVGDRVRIADAVGDVVEKTTLVTRIRTVKNVDITIPNAMVMSNHIINFTSQAQSTAVILHTTVTIGYDVEWRRIHELLIEAARATGRIEGEPAPFVLQTGLDDFYVRYELNAYTRDPGRMAAITSELHQNIQDRLHGAGIEIASPHLSSLRDGNRREVPDPYLPTDYEQPAFHFLPVGSVRSRPRTDDGS
jgi:small-conductance mechanosensitive channel